MRVSMLQFKPTIGDVDGNFDRAEELIERALSDQTDVIVLPELWSTGYYPTPLEKFADVDGQRSKKFLTYMAQSNKVNVAGGTVAVADGGKFYNRSYAIDRSGMIRAEYDKAHLFSPAGEEKVFAAGDRLATYTFDGVKCSTVVCYDIRFPETIRRLALGGVELMFVVAAWPIKRLEHWRILNRARAIENQMYVAAVNSGGHSLAIDPWGEIMIEGSIGDEILTVEIDLEQRATIRSTMNVFADRNFIIDHV